MVFPKNLNYVTVFVADYSIDIFGDLIIAKFETLMTAKGGALKRQ